MANKVPAKKKFQELLFELSTGKDLLYHSPFDTKNGILNQNEYNEIVELFVNNISNNLKRILKLQLSSVDISNIRNRYYDEVYDMCFSDTEDPTEDEIDKALDKYILEKWSPISEPIRADQLEFSICSENETNCTYLEVYRRWIESDEEYTKRVSKNKINTIERKRKKEEKDRKYKTAQYLKLKEELGL